MTNFPHCGLYFTPNQIEEAKKFTRREPFTAAWDRLHQPPQPEFIPSTLWNGLRYRFDDDRAAGAKAVENLLHDPALTALFEDPTAYLDQIITLVSWVQCFELVRDHPEFTIHNRKVWLEALTGRVEYLNHPDTTELMQVERIWLALLNLTAGVVLENDGLVEDSAGVYRTVIDHDIRPEGYLPAAVEDKDGNSLLRLLLSVKGLILTAEAARSVGIDLWQYSNRGVSVITAGLYPLYYYFYPEKWRWDANLDQAEAQRLFRLHGSFLEPLNHQIGHPTRAIDLILKDLRPVVDVWGGGILSLSHGVAIRRGLFR